MIPSPPIVLLDACVLYLAALRDLLMRLAVHEQIMVKRSEKIHEEWMTTVPRERSNLTLQQLERTRQLMDLHVGDCLVSGHELRVESLWQPNENDRHGLAAAIEAEADALVTWILGGSWSSKILLRRTESPPSRLKMSTESSSAAASTRVLPLVYAASFLSQSRWGVVHDREESKVCRSRSSL